MCDVNVGSSVCQFVHRKHCLDCSDGVDSEGEVNKLLRNVSGHCSVYGGWATRTDGHGRGKVSERGGYGQIVAARRQRWYCCVTVGRGLASEC